mgnify:CR=1 FL=1
MAVEGIPRGRASPPQTPPALKAKMLLFIQCQSFFGEGVLSWLFKYVKCPVWGRSIGYGLSVSQDKQSDISFISRSSYEPGTYRVQDKSDKSYHKLLCSPNSVRGVWFL